jgi:hypothetical protein
MFEPPSGDSTAYPSFAALFDPGNLYLELLHLPTQLPDGRTPFDTVLEAMAQSPDADAELAALFADPSWRPHLVAASALLAAGATPARLDLLWGTLARGSWISPQLAVTAWLLDDDFESRAGTIITVGRWPKTKAALGHFYRRLPAPKLKVLSSLADPRLVSDGEARDGALYANEWMTKLAAVTTAEMRARWRRSPDPTAANRSP